MFLNLPDGLVSDKCKLQNNKNQCDLIYVKEYPQSTTLYLYIFMHMDVNAWNRLWKDHTKALTVVITRALLNGPGNGRGVSKEILVISVMFSLLFQGKCIPVLLLWDSKEIKMNQLKVIFCNSFWKVNRRV